MTQRLPKGTILHTDDGERLRVLDLLGAGGQGEVYDVDQGGTHYALKWYYPPPRDPRAQAQAQEQRAALREYILPKGAPDPRFVWPLAFVEGEPGSGTFGYLMQLWKPGYETLERLVCGRVPSASDRILATASLGIVDAFRKLHLSGAVYKDINLGGFAFDPKRGDVLVVDNDNVRTNGTPGAILFPGFGAPEVVMGRAPCSTTSDDHSLAVLLFYIFCRGNPMEGARELVNCYDMTATRSLFGDEALFVFDPKDASNRPVAGVHDSVLRNWASLPPALSTAFTRAFTEGLHDPSKRLTDGEWVQVLSTFRDSLFPCAHCKRETTYAREAMKPGESFTCAWCKRPLSPPARMKIGASIVVLSPDLRLYPHHLGDTADFSAPVAEVTAHPSKPNTWGLKNTSSKPWSYNVGDGPTHVVDPGQSAPISDGLRIQFGRVQGTVRASS
jgi:DNA-binding helix-hairpin-helix protein with protein kinase domain